MSARRTDRFRPLHTVIHTHDGSSTGHRTHYVETRVGAHARMWFGPGTFVYVYLWRKGNKRPTLQGWVERRDGQYVAFTPKGEEYARTEYYVQAEVALLERPSRQLARANLAWPLEITVMLGPRPRPECGVCGHELAGGVCVRPDLHWESRAGR
jgi:hypothetical protein